MPRRAEAAAKEASTESERANVPRLRRTCFSKAKMAIAAAASHEGNNEDEEAALAELGVRSRRGAGRSLQGHDFEELSQATKTETEPDTDASQIGGEGEEKEEAGGEADEDYANSMSSEQEVPLQLSQEDDTSMTSLPSPMGSPQTKRYASKKKASAVHKRKNRDSEDRANAVVRSKSKATAPLPACDEDDSAVPRSPRKKLRVNKK